MTERAEAELNNSPRAKYREPTAWGNPIDMDVSHDDTLPSNSKMVCKTTDKTMDNSNSESTTFIANTINEGRQTTSQSDKKIINQNTPWNQPVPTAWGDDPGELNFCIDTKGDTLISQSDKKIINQNTPWFQPAPTAWGDDPGELNLCHTESTASSTDKKDTDRNVKKKRPVKTAIRSKHKSNRDRYYNQKPQRGQDSDDNSDDNPDFAGIVVITPSKSYSSRTDNDDDFSNQKDFIPLS